MFNMGSGATNFMGATSKHKLSTEIFFQILYTYIAEVIKRLKAASHQQRLNLPKVLLRIWFSNFYQRLVMS